MSLSVHHVSSTHAETRQHTLQLQQGSSCTRRRDWHTQAERLEVVRNTWPASRVSTLAICCMPVVAMSVRAHSHTLARRSRLTWDRCAQENEQVFHVRHLTSRGLCFGTLLPKRWDVREPEARYLSLRCSNGRHGQKQSNESNIALVCVASWAPTEKLDNWLLINFVSCSVASSLPRFSSQKWKERFGSNVQILLRRNFSLIVATSKIQFLRTVLCANHETVLLKVLWLQCIPTVQLIPLMMFFQ